jgi:hypothetical protein
MRFDRALDLPLTVQVNRTGGRSNKAVRLLQDDGGARGASAGADRGTGHTVSFAQNDDALTL